MSSLLRPVGHLPASVYWVRRALVLVVLVVLTVVLLKLLGGGGEDPKNSAATAPEPSPTATSTTGSSPTSTPSRGRGDNEPDGPTKAKDTTCDGTEVRITVLPAARQIAPGAALNLEVSLSAVRDQCTAKIDATQLSLTIMSGNDRIWSTTHCRQLIPQATLVLAKGKESSSTVVWNGRRSRPGCLPGQPTAKAGTYVAQAAYDGRASVAQAFQIKP